MSFAPLTALVLLRVATTLFFVYSSSAHRRRACTIHTMATGVTPDATMKKGKRPYSVTVLIIMFSILLMIQWSNLMFSPAFHTESLKKELLDQQLMLMQQSLKKQLQFPGVSSLEVPQGEAVAMPSIRISKEEESAIDRKWYGGVGDEKHLGGFVEVDLDGISPAAWKYMITQLGIKSILDVGCGRGISTSWFALHGVDTMCVEGSHDAIEKSMFTQGPMVEHDFSRGPWWPPRTIDAVWSVEFLEHVGRNFQQNYVPAFRKAALIFATHSNWGGWHHVEVHGDDWWKTKMQSYGFVYSSSLTEKIRLIAKDERRKKILSPIGMPYTGQHIWMSMQVRETISCVMCLTVGIAVPCLACFRFCCVLCVLQWCNCSHSVADASIKLVLRFISTRLLPPCLSTSICLPSMVAL